MLSELDVQWLLKPGRKFFRLDRKSSRGMIYENEELRLRTININAEVEKGQSDIKKLRRENEQLRREIWSLRDEYEKLDRLIKSKSGSSKSTSCSSDEESNSTCTSCNDDSDPEETTQNAQNQERTSQRYDFDKLSIVSEESSNVEQEPEQKPSFQFSEMHSSVNIFNNCLLRPDQAYPISFLYGSQVNINALHEPTKSTKTVSTIMPQQCNDYPLNLTFDLLKCPKKSMDLVVNQNVIPKIVTTPPIDKTDQVVNVQDNGDNTFQNGGNLDDLLKDLTNNMDSVDFSTSTESNASTVRFNPKPTTPETQYPNPMPLLGFDKYKTQPLEIIIPKDTVDIGNPFSAETFLLPHLPHTSVSTLNSPNIFFPPNDTCQFATFDAATCKQCTDPLNKEISIASDINSPRIIEANFPFDEAENMETKKEVREEVEKCQVQHQTGKKTKKFSIHFRGKKKLTVKTGQTIDESEKVKAESPTKTESVNQLTVATTPRARRNSNTSEKKHVTIESNNNQGAKSKMKCRSDSCSKKHRSRKLENKSCSFDSVRSNRYFDSFNENSERERTNSLSNSDTSSRNPSRKLSLSNYNVAKVPWCGCWGNGCL